MGKMYSVRNVATGLAILSVNAGPSVAGENPKLSGEKPNVVIILADDMGYGDVSSNNPFARTSTPAIDKLAQEGIRFTDAHSGGSVCTPPGTVSLPDVISSGSLKGRPIGDIWPL